MKICLINSSYEGVNSPFEKVSHSLQFPASEYIPKTRHEFVTRWVTKANSKAEIDQICEEDFDMFMNYMWGIETDDVAGVEATRYLESKGVPILTNPSRFLAKTKLDLQRAANKIGLRIPRDTPERYPKIVKYADGYGSLNLDYNSICHSEDQVKNRVAFLQKDNDTFGVLVQDYIVGKECSAIVVEMGPEVVALTPLQYVFPDNTPANEEFLTWYNKFEACEKGTIKYAFVEDKNQAKLQQAAADAFKAIGVSGGGAWARVDMRLEEGTGDVYVIEVNCIPVVFYPEGNTLGDDLVVGEKFPGGQAAFFDMMLATKQMQLGWYKDRSIHVAGVYDKFAPTYNSVWEESGLHKLQRFFASNYDFSGTVLDMACGTGAIGHVFSSVGLKADITGIEISEGMLQSPDIKKYYKNPIRVGPMQELIMGAGEFDHIVCFGALHFLDSVQLNAVLARMFMLARKSVTFEVDDLDDEYINEAFKKHGELCFNANHVRTVEEFGVPKGWNLVHKKREFLYKSPTTQGDVDGYAMRFEKV
ncbi:Fc.00g025130.m01.CDS01 [Cosmosporella sp. VM-42]